MTPYVALLRAVNVGGAGALPMSRLKAHCDCSGFMRAATYLASGNAVFLAQDSEATVKAKLQTALIADLGRSAHVLVRTAAQLGAVIAANPFAASPPARTVAIFLDMPPPKDLLQTVTGQKDETIFAGVREIYVDYPCGQGASKLKIPAGKSGTARNFNTIAKLAALSAALV